MTQTSTSKQDGFLLTSRHAIFREVLNAALWIAIAGLTATSLGACSGGDDEGAKADRKEKGPYEDKPHCAEFLACCGALEGHSQESCLSLLDSIDGSDTGCEFTIAAYSNQCSEADTEHGAEMGGASSQ